MLESEGMPPKRYGVGDVIFFRNGAHAKWHVEGHVKKVAFFRQTNPFGLGLAVRALNKLKRMFFVPGGRQLHAATSPCPTLCSQCRSGPLFVAAQNTRPCCRALP